MIPEARKTVGVMNKSDNQDIKKSTVFLQVNIVAHAMYTNLPRSIGKNILELFHRESIGQSSTFRNLSRHAWLFPKG
ncbi:hypothetical protein DSUL_50228 [Desulfovibrionales bacterium]